MPFVIGKNCKKAATLSARERPDLFHGGRRRLVLSARSGGFRRAAPNPLKPIPNYRRDRNKLKTNSSLSSGGGPRGPGPKNKSLPPHPPDCARTTSTTTNIVDIVPRARKAVIEISLSLILATPGCTFLPRAHEGQCRQLRTQFRSSPIRGRGLARPSFIALVEE